MRHPARIRQVLAGFLTLTSTLPALSQSSGPAEYEVWYSLTAEVRGAGADADIQAGGRLLMSIDPKVAGGKRLELVRPLEDPWKLYSVDPLGPFGGETKLALVTTLPEASWEALEEAQDKIARIGRERHARWIESTQRKRPLDGSFGFIAIGPTAGRFAIDFLPDGSVLEVTNRLTDRWLPGPFDQFIGADELPHGYWFWNQGETKPFEWEPHTYHALAAALELLALPLSLPPLPPMPAPEADRLTVSWERSSALALEVLTTLAPKIAHRLRDEPPVPNAIEVGGSKSGRSLTLRVDRPEQGLHIERETTLSDSPTPPESDRLRLRLESPRRLLAIEVGYARVDPRAFPGSG